MNAILGHARLNLRLNFRNPTAIIYGFLFPLLFLVAFAVLYRHEAVPLALHMGELLTVTALGGACFGLPTALVAERERGVWRRYRMTPEPAASFIASTLLSRFALLLMAALLQVALALAIGAPLPADPVGLFIAFACVSFAFLAIGMFIAMVAGSVPAVQALGQCIFLPMLIIGGVAVRLTSLPEWAQNLSLFFPGGYAVAAIQQAWSGSAPPGSWANLAALLAMAIAGGIAAASAFRWDTRARRLHRPGLILATILWLTIGACVLLFARQDRLEAGGDEVAPPVAYIDAQPASVAPSATASGSDPPASEFAAQPSPASSAEERSALQTRSPEATAETPNAPPSRASAAAPQNWREITDALIAGVAFERLPPDSGLVAPIAASADPVDAAIAGQLETIRQTLPGWSGARPADPVQDVRNHLYIAAVPDLLQIDPLERHVPMVVLERLQSKYPGDDLRRLLYWIALHPDDGEDRAIQLLPELGLPHASGPTRRVRQRVMLYAFKFLGRLES